MERKIYNKPLLVREQFVPQDYVAACESITISSEVSSKRNYLRIDIDHDGHFGSGATADPEFGFNAFSLSPSTLDLVNDSHNTIENINVYRYIGGQGDAYEANMDYSNPNNFRLIATQVIKRVWQGNDLYYLYKPASSATTSDLSLFPTITTGKNRS